MNQLTEFLISITAKVPVNTAAIFAMVFLVWLSYRLAGKKLELKVINNARGKNRKKQRKKQGQTTFFVFSPLRAPVNLKPVNLQMGFARLREGTQLRAANGLRPPPGGMSPP